MIREEGCYTFFSYLPNLKKIYGAVIFFLTQDYMGKTLFLPQFSSDLNQTLREHWPPWVNTGYYWTRQSTKFKQEVHGLGALLSLLDKMEDNDRIKLNNIEI